MSSHAKEHGVPLAGAASLNANGTFVLPLPPLLCDAMELFIRRLDDGTGRWYMRMIELALAAPLERPGHGFDAATVRRQGEEYAVAPEAERDAMVQQFNPATDEGRARLFDADERKRLTRDSIYGEFVRNLVQRAKQGNTPMAQSALHQGWTESGFGMWAHLVPAVGLDMAVQVAHLLRELFGLSSSLPHHFPHVIYKPDKGSELKAHHDQINPRVLLTQLRLHVASTDPSTLGWVRRVGLQMLAHLQGGDAIDAGPTYIVGPMTPARLLICLEAIADGRVAAPVQLPMWWDQKQGPYFFPWEQSLPAFNAALEAADEPGDLRVIPIIPSAADRAEAGVEPDQSLPFALGWPVGFPHGSLRNRGARRVTVTLPLNVVNGGLHLPLDPDTAQWLRALGALADPGTPPHELQHAEQLVERRGYMDSFADGPTHRRPSAAAALIRHPVHAESALVAFGGARQPGWFWEVAPKRSEVEDFLRAFGTTETAFTPAAAAASSSSAGPSSGPDDGERDRLVREASEDDRMGGEDGEDSEDDPMDTVPLSQLLRADAIERAIAARLAPLAALEQAGVLDGLRAGTLRMLNVRQPWASLLVLGHKTIENRSTGAVPPRPNEWVLIVASKPQPTASVMQGMLRDYEGAIGDQREAARRVRELTERFDRQWPSQAIVGLVRFDRVDPPGTPGLTNAPWYHSPDAAWRVGAHHSFATPIEGIHGTLSIRRISKLPLNVGVRVERELLQRLS